MAEEILKVHLRSDAIKYVIIPKSSQIHGGDYVVVSNDMDILKTIKSVKEEKING